MIEELTKRLEENYPKFVEVIDRWDNIGISFKWVYLWGIESKDIETIKKHIKKNI